MHAVLLKKHAQLESWRESERKLYSIFDTRRDFYQLNPSQTQNKQFATCDILGEFVFCRTAPEGRDGPARVANTLRLSLGVLSCLSLPIWAHKSVLENTLCLCLLFAWDSMNTENCGLVISHSSAVQLTSISGQSKHIEKDLRVLEGFLLFLFQLWSKSKDCKLPQHGLKSNGVARVNFFVH
jgi:hypothetical protein